jgi:hypothetical protein
MMQSCRDSLIVCLVCHKISSILSKKHFATEALDAKIKTLVATKKTHTSLGKGIEKVIAVLLSLADLYNINPTATTDICMAYSNTMGIFYDISYREILLLKDSRYLL